MVAKDGVHECVWSENSFGYVLDITEGGMGPERRCDEGGGGDGEDEGSDGGQAEDGEFHDVESDCCLVSCALTRNCVYSLHNL